MGRYEEISRQPEIPKVVRDESWPEIPKAITFDKIVSYLQNYCQNKLPALQNLVDFIFGFAGPSLSQYQNMKSIRAISHTSITIFKNMSVMMLSNLKFRKYAAIM